MAVTSGRKTGITLFLLACFVMMITGCNATKDTAVSSNVSGSLNQRRCLEGDVAPEEHASPYIALFQTDYPDMEITKIRWQTLHTGQETYIIEGVKDKEKCIVKYLMDTNTVLGRVERELSSEEMADGKCIEKPLQLDGLLSITELSEITINELGGEMQELRICWKEDVPLAYAEVRDENLRAQGIVINAVTGEILH